MSGDSLICSPLRSLFRTGEREREERQRDRERESLNVCPYIGVRVCVCVRVLYTTGGTGTTLEPEINIID